MAKSYHVIRSEGKWIVRKESGERDSRMFSSRADASSLACSVHVISRSDGKWSVRKTGEGRASRVFSNQRDAISFARSVAKSSKSEMIIHSRDGRIRDSDSYGQDPCPPRNRL